MKIDFRAPKKVAHQEFYEISEDEVINAGLITRGIYVNENVNEKDEVENDYDYLLELADLKRQEIYNGYQMLYLSYSDVCLMPCIMPT